MADFIRMLVLPILKAALACVAWGLALFYGWRALALSVDMLARRGTGANAGRTSQRMLEEVEAVVSTAIMAGIGALFLVACLWFLTCHFSPVTANSVRRLRGRWYLTFLVNFVLTFGTLFYFGVVLGNLGTRLASNALLVQGSTLLVLFFLGYWIVTAFATHKTYRPAIPPF